MQTRNLFLIVASALIGLSTALAAQSVYKWVDENGTVHFSSRPPPEHDFEIVNTTDQPPPNPTAVVEPEAASTPEPRMPRQKAPDPEIIAARCQQARENLFWLQAKRRILVERDDGSEEFIDADEKQKMIDDGQTLIEEWCRDD